jgi:hypothetical protein
MKSDVYVYDDMSTGEVTIRLDVPRDPADKPDFAEIQPGTMVPL